MVPKYSVSKKGDIIIIGVLLLAILIILMLFLSERNKYVNEKGKSEKVAIYLYKLEVESPLMVLSYFLGIRSIESVDWNDKVFQEDLKHLFRDLDHGISNIDNLEAEVIPEKTRTYIQTIREKIAPIYNAIRKEDTLDEMTKAKVMAFSETISSCELGGVKRSYKQIDSKLECLIRSIDSQ